MKNIETITAEHIKGEFAFNQRPENFISKHFILVRQSDFIMRQSRLRQPMRLSEIRFLRVISGHADYRINLVDQHLKNGDMLILPSNTLLEVEAFSDQYKVEVLAVIDFPGIDYELIQKTIPVEVIHLSLSENDEKHIESYFLLLSQLMKNPETSDIAISHLALSMASELNRLKARHSQEFNFSKHSRGENIMIQFIELIRQYGSTNRSVPFYADKLALTPNHLSAVVRQQSGLSVMDWLNRTTITEAKVLLKHSNLMIYEIGEKLNFLEPTAFNRYFKKHLGITPKEYRIR